MGSLNETVKAVSVDGNAATVEGIKDGSYTLARPFVVTTYGEVGEIAQDLLNYIMSAEGQAIINEEGYIAINDRRRGLHRRWRVRRDHRGRLLLRDPRHGEAAEAYMALNPDVTVVVQQSDSTTGVTGTIEGTVDLGMASRALKAEEEEQGVVGTTIAMDGIAVIVNLENDTENLTTEQIMNIYTAPSPIGANWPRKLPHSDSAIGTHQSAGGLFARARSMYMSKNTHETDATGGLKGFLAGGARG